MNPVPSAKTPRLLLAVAAAAVGFAAADTYVVVLALPDMMASVGLNLDQLQRAAPIISGFLLGYIAMLPLIGRIADLRGRIPVLLGSLVLFSLGSLVTAASYDLTTMVIGRFLQGVGGGGLVPTTLALVADMWPAERRGLPLGLVGAVQELGSVIGPLYGALVLTVWTWHAIFWLNLAVGITLAVWLRLLRPTGGRDMGQSSRDWLGALCGLAAIVGLTLVLVEPQRLVAGLTTGLAFIPYVAGSRWTTPVAFATYAFVALFLVRECTARRPLVRLRGNRPLFSGADLPGAALLASALAGVVLAFATADPQVQVLSRLGGFFLLGSACAAALFLWRQRRAAAPLIPREALRSRPAWGSMVVSFFVGSALIAALVDVPVFARVTIYPKSQLGAALVLVRLLAALPVGALLGGALLGRIRAFPVAAAGMALAAFAFVWMTRWTLASLDSWTATVPLVLCGLGFGLTLAPVNAALLSATRADVHGVASALLVVVRMIGMLVGISALTTLGLHRFYSVSATIPPVAEMCPAQRLCAAYILQLKSAAVAQLHVIFAGAAVSACLAAVLSVALLRSAAAEEARSITGYGL